MAKTYGTVTTFTAGSVLTAAQLNVASTAVNNLVVPASAQIYKTTTAAHTSGNVVTMASTGSFPNYWDTDSGLMTAVANTITITTPGIYAVTYAGGISSAATAFTQVTVGVQINGNRAGISFATIGSSGISAYWSNTIFLGLALNDALTLRVDYTGGSTVQVIGNASTDYTQTRLSATWVGRTS